MPFTDQLVATIAAAEYPQLNGLSRDVWRSWAAGTITDQDAQAAAEAIQARRTVAPVPTAPPGQRSVFPKRRAQRTPDRQRSIERRRRLAASGPLPPQLAAHFTTGELAVLRIVGDEVRAHGACSLHVDAIAARAGVGRTTAQNALREARALGLMTVQERRRRGQPSLTNIVRIVSAEWRTWLRLGGGGFKKLNSTDSRYSEEGQKWGKLVANRERVKDHSAAHSGLTNVKRQYR
jgi:hypothetical protein